METTSASPRTSESAVATGAAVAHRSAIARRVVALFILSALLPLSLCAALLFRQSTSELERTQRQALDGLVRSFGMTLLGRLQGADDVIRTIISQPGASDGDVQDQVAKLEWVRSLHRVSPTRIEAGLPAPTPRQQQALQTREPVLLLGTDEHGNTQVFLVRALPGSAWLYTELNSTWLWADMSDYAGAAALLVINERGERLAAAGVEPENGLLRSWELFLPSHFSTPSWRLLATAPRPTVLHNASGTYPYVLGFIALTILLIAWLSMTTIRRQLRPLELLTEGTRRVAQRDFDAFREMRWNDEFGDLARSFDTMADRLRRQFAALETLAEVDRLLLSTPKLELILDTLLPRIANLLGCDSVSVLLFDTDSNSHARAYDFLSSQREQLPVRRIAVDIAKLRAVCDDSASPLIDAAGPAPLACLVPSGPLPISAVRVQPLRYDGECVGALCVGYVRETDHMHDAGITAVDFADRLSLILANLKQAERLHRQANFDALTGLQNRQLFSDHLRAAVVSAQATGTVGSLLYIDLDHFKHVNDTAGHAAGDALLRMVAQRLIACVGEGQSIARLGGDEFAVLLPTIAEPDNARRIAERIISGLQQPIAVDGREHQVTASIGMTVFPADGTTLEALLKAGDIAMYHAKDAGRCQAVFFQNEMQQKLIQRLKLETGLQRALQRQDFTLHYQPIVCEAGSGSHAVEALVRWPGMDQAPWISPAEFVPVAEENGLIVKLGEWILRSACEQFKHWRAAGLRLSYVSVNVSVRQLKEPDYVVTLLSILKDNSMQGADLQLEITESVLSHGAAIQRTLEAIAACGVRLALDDFGTGYSSLSYLRTYPIHTVKIDRSFIHGLPHDVAACRLAESIIVMCSALGKDVVAEGVESEAQRQFLRRSGCPTMQGYLLGRPMEAADIPGFLRRLRSTLDSIDNDGTAAQTTRPQSGAERGEHEIGGKGSATGRETSGA